MKHRLPFNIEKHLKLQLGGHNMAVYPDSSGINDALKLAFAETKQEVYKMVSDVRFSGSTCTSILTYGRKVYCANVGDSRTILIRAGPQGQGKSRAR
jgi:serine/threonine protein phosphatase PrpC